MYIRALHHLHTHTYVHTTPYSTHPLHGEEFHQRENQVSVQKGPKFGGEIILGHLEGLAVKLVNDVYCLMLTSPTGHTLTFWDILWLF